MLSDSTIKNTKNLRQKFPKAKPYPSAFVKNFLKPEVAEALRKEVLKEPFERQDKDLFSFSNTKELSHSKSKTLRDFHAFFSSKDFLRTISAMTGEKLSSIDMHAHLYEKGDYLLFHDDLVERRKIAYILYLSKGFASKDGGRLELFDVKKPRIPVVSIVPEFNSLVMFKVSKKSLHRVEEIFADKQRITLGGWFYGP